MIAPWNKALRLWSMAALSLMVCCGGHAVVPPPTPDQPLTLSGDVHYTFQPLDSDECNSVSLGSAVSFAFVSGDPPDHRYRAMIKLYPYTGAGVYQASSDTDVDNTNVIVWRGGPGRWDSHGALVSASGVIVVEADTSRPRGRVDVTVFDPRAPSGPTSRLYGSWRCQSDLSRATPPA